MNYLQNTEHQLIMTVKDIVPAVRTTIIFMVNKWQKVTVARQAANDSRHYGHCANSFCEQKPWSNHDILLRSIVLKRLRYESNPCLPS